MQNLDMATLAEEIASLVADEIERAIAPFKERMAATDARVDLLAKMLLRPDDAKGVR